MSELNYVELPVIRWLSGQGSTDPNETGLGWTYRDAAEMDSFDRPLEDPIVKKLLPQLTAYLDALEINGTSIISSINQLQPESFPESSPQG